MADGLPTIAECGGFLYLHETLCDDEGVCYPMGGSDSGVGYKYRETGALRLCDAYGKGGELPPAGAQIAGHEFHYYDSTDNGVGAVGQKAG